MTINTTLSIEQPCEYKLILKEALDTVRSLDRVNDVGVNLRNEFADFRRERTSPHRWWVNLLVMIIPHFLIIQGGNLFSGKAWIPAYAGMTV